MGYTEAPWTFKGRALYQLQLVKAEEARKYVPPELKLVEFFGHTLGGVYLARYEDSPAGAFDECVVMAGLVWNPPTSCAWAARVFVNNKDARDHGVASVGLPSRLAAFGDVTTHTGQPGSSSSSVGSSSAGRGGGWWQPRQQQRRLQLASGASTTAGGAGIGGGSASASSSRVGGDGGGSAGLLRGEEVVELRNVQPGPKGLPGRPVALLRLPQVAGSGGGGGGFPGPRLRLSLPSFSGGTREYPALLQYSCDLQASVMPVAPMQVLLPGSSNKGADQQQQQQHHHHHHHQHQHQQPGKLWGWRKQKQPQQQSQQQHPEVLDLLLTGKPLVCLAFSDMVMKVEEPTRLQLPAVQQQQQQPAAARGGRSHPAFAAVLPGTGGTC